MVAIARGAAVAVVALSLVSCNVVDSDKALFTDADRADAPAMAPGLWANEACTADGLRRHEAPCVLTYEVSSSAVVLVIDQKAYLKTEEGKTARTKPPEGGKRLPLSYLLAGKGPTVVQLEFAGGDGSPPSYAFFALEPAPGQDGPATVAELWPVLCGPPPTAEERAAFARDARKAQDYIPTMPLTYAPFAGMEAQGSSCHPKDRDAVVAAARSSRAIAGPATSLMMAGQQRIHLVGSTPR